MTHVDLSDVQAITVETNDVEGGYCGCDSITLPTTVKVVLKPGRRHDLLPHCCNQPLIEFKHCHKYSTNDYPDTPQNSQPLQIAVERMTDPETNESSIQCILSQIS